MSALDFSLSVEWSEKIQIEMKTWIVEEWSRLSGEAPDQDFLEYVLVMVKNQKKMQEISNELKDLGVDEPTASDFSTNLGEKLMTLEKSQLGVTISTGSLKSSRGNVASDSVSSTIAGPSRLLNSALQSSRPSKSEVMAAERSKKSVSDREHHQGSNKRIKSHTAQDSYKRNVVTSSNSSSGNQFVQYQQPPPPQSLPPPQVLDSSSLNTVAYFEQMNRVAQMSGFRNAQEMLASQKEMVAIMHQAPVNATLPFVPPYPTTAPPLPPYHGNKYYNTNASRGQHHSVQQSPSSVETGLQPAAAAASTEHSGVTPQYPYPSVYRGRGRGREGYLGGRGFTGIGAPHVSSGEQAVTPAAIAAQVEANATEFETAVASTGYFPVDTGRGRGSFRGRGGGRGRGRGNLFHNADGSAPVAPVGNKTWVREAELGSALVTGR